MGFEQLTWDTTKDAITIGLSLEPLVMIAFKCLFLLFFSLDCKLLGYIFLFMEFLGCGFWI